MRQETKDNLALAGKSLLVIVGGLLVVAATVDLVVGGPRLRDLAYLLVGLLLSVPPVAFAFLDALKAGRRQPR